MEKNELLPTIREDDDTKEEEDDDIEVIECPGIEGSSKQ